jgi:hypothetical protein
MNLDKTNMKRIENFVLLSVFMVLFIEPTYSQDTLTTDDYYIDFSVPDLGAFTLLNTKPDNITTPGNTKEFAASLLNLVSGGSNITSGLAIDWAPVKTFCKTTTLQEYKRNHWLRNLQITFGAIKDSIGTKVGAGIKWTFIDHTDPLLDNKYGTNLINLHQNTFIDLATSKNSFILEVLHFLQDIQKNRDSLKKSDLSHNHNILNLFDFGDTITAKKELSVYYTIVVDSVNKGINKITHATNDTLNIEEKGNLYHLCYKFKSLYDQEEQYNKDVTADFEKAKKRWLNEHWNATVLSFGAGWVGNSKDSKWCTLNTQLFKTYINGKFRVSKKTQAIGMISYGIPHYTTSTDSTIVSQIFFGGRFLVGNASNRFSVDLGYNMNYAKSSSFNSKILVSDIAVEFKLDDGVFLEIASGFEGAPSNFIKNSNILALGSLKYAIHPKARFNLPE